MKPYIVIFNAASLDGRLTGFNADLGLYYGLVAEWKEDATLVGSQTILAAGEQMPAEGDEPLTVPEKDPSLPLLVVPDSRGMIRSWSYLRIQPYWRDVVVLCSRSTPETYLEGLRMQSIHHLITGEEHVDLQAALEELNTRFGVKVVRVDSGGILNGLLLQAGLVDEISLLLHPAIVGDQGTVPFVQWPEGYAPAGAFELRLKHCEKVGEQAIWVRYEVVRS